MKAKKTPMKEQTIFSKDPVYGMIGSVPIKKISGVYLLGKQLGKGSFGTAFLATHIASKKVVVVKKSNDKIHLNEFALQEVEGEVNFLKSFASAHGGCNPYIACYYDSFIDRDSLENDKHQTCRLCHTAGDVEDECKLHKVGTYCIVMEYIQGKSLFDLMGKLDEETVWYMAQDLLRGLKDIHCRGVLHNDIKPDNVMFDTLSKQVKFVDFGLSCIKEKRSDKCSGGTAGYIAPEVEDLYEPRFRDERSDVYALGIALAEVVLNEQIDVPKSLKKRREELRFIQVKTTKHVKTHVKMHKLKALLVDMLKNYRQRPYADQLLTKYF